MLLYFTDKMFSHRAVGKEEKILFFVVGKLQKFELNRHITFLYEFTFNLHFLYISHFLN